MQIKSIITTLVTGLIVLAACKKNDAGSSSTDGNASTNNCVVAQGEEDGSIIPDQYIVAYRESTATGVDLTTTARIASFTNTILQKHSININAIKQSFSGGARGLNCSG